jgi:acyl-CoA reductase-like NAD-dependent aldehyde dehydrogenase
MNRNDIIRMAREAGIVWDDHTVVGSRENLLERFADLVAAHEREACMAVCWDVGGLEATTCANLIRAKGEV